MSQFNLDESAKSALRHLVLRELDGMIERAGKVGFDCEETLAMLGEVLGGRARQKAEATSASIKEWPDPNCRH